jgi:hypothetical protein
LIEFNARISEDFTLYFDAIFDTESPFFTTYSTVFTVAFSEVVFLSLAIGAIG